MADTEKRLRVVTEYDMKQPVNALGELEKAAKTTADAVAKIQKELKDTNDVAKRDELKTALAGAKVAADNATVAVEKMRKSMDITQMGTKQLETYMAKLKVQISQMKTDTVAYVEANKRFGEVKAQYDKVIKVQKELRLEGENLAKPGLWDKAKNAVLDMTGGMVIGLAAAGMAIKAALSSAVEGFLDFDKASHDLRAETGMAEKDLGYFKEQAAKVGPQFGKTATEMVEAYNLIASANSDLVLNRKELEGVTNAAIKLSVVGGIDLPQAAKVTAESLNQFGASAKEAEKFVDIMATGSQVGAEKIEGLSQALAYVGPLAHKTGLDFADTNAALQVLSVNGLHAEKAGTGLRGALANLLKGANETNPAVVGLQKATESLHKKFEAMHSPAERAKVAIDLFGKENVSAGLILVDNSKKLKEFTDKINTGGGAAAMMAEKQKALSFQLSQAKAEVVNMALKLGSFLAPAFVKVVQVGVAFMKTLMAIPKFLYDNRDAITLLMGGVAMFNMHLIVTNAQLLISAGLYKAEIIWKEASAVATNVLKVAQLGLNAAFRANPVGVVAGLITILITVTYEAYKKFYKFRAAVDVVIDGFVPLIKLVGEFMAMIAHPWDISGVVGAFKNLKQVTTKAMDDSIAATKAGYQKQIDANVAKNKQVAEDNKAAAQTAADLKAAQDLIGADAQGSTDKKAESANKKHLDEIGKANEEALKKLDELRKEARLEHIRTMDGEVAYEKAKLQETFEEEKTAIQKSLASQANKAEQIKLLKEKLGTDLKNLEEKHQQETAVIVDKWLTNDFDKKVNSAKATAVKEIETARKTVGDKQELAAIELKINEWLKNEVVKINEEEAEQVVKKAEEAGKKKTQIALKELDAKKFILEQETKANKYLYDSLELSAGRNATKLTAIKKERLDKELQLLFDKIKLEEQAEALKITQDIKDETERTRALKQLHDAYRNQELEATKKAEQDKLSVEQKADELRGKRREAISGAFGALLKGDLKGFMDNVGKMADGEKSGWQKRLEENTKGLQMVSQLAVQALNFLTDLAKKRAEAEIAIVKAEYEQKKQLLEQSIAADKAGIEAANAAKKQLTSDYQAATATQKQGFEDQMYALEKNYRDLNSVDNKANLAKTLADYRDNADEKIDAARDKYNQEVDAAKDAERQKRIEATNTKDKTIQAAEEEKRATIDAIDDKLKADKNALDLRTDLSKAQKAAEKDMLDKQAREQKEAATDKLAFDKKMAAETFQNTVDTAEKTKDNALKLAADLKENDIKLANDIRNADDDTAKQLLKTSQETAKQKIQDAKDENNKILADNKTRYDNNVAAVDAEKQKLIDHKKDLEQQLHQADISAKQQEVQLKYKADMTKWRNDKISAAVTGAMGVLSGLAAPFPLGFIMAALAGVMAGVQIGMINRNQPQAPSFAFGGLTPQAGMGGMPGGNYKHGMNFGDDGLALVSNRTGEVVGETQSNEAIISEDQTKANLPFIQKMWEKARKGDKTPVYDANTSRPMVYKFGGILPKISGKMFEYGGSISGASGGSVSDSMPNGTDVASSQEAAAKHTELLGKIVEETKGTRKDLAALLKEVSKNTEDTKNAVDKTTSAVNEGRALDKISGLLARLGTFR